MRLTPLPTAEWDDAARNALRLGVPPERLTCEGSGNALSTLVRNPGLTRAYMPLSVYLKDGSTLPLELREMAILRLAARMKCDYQWVHHAAIASHVGLSEGDVDAAGGGQSENLLFAPVLDAVDELLTDFRISDATWTALGEHLDDRQRMDLVFTIGGYAMLAMGINSFGVEVEDAGWRTAADYATPINEAVTR